MLKYQVKIYDILVHKWIEHQRHNQTHRINNPAVVYIDQDMMWYQYGDRHRKNGPAIIRRYGHIEHWIRRIKQC